MAKESTRVGEGRNVDRLDNVKKEIAAAAQFVNRRKEERREINEDIAAKRTHLETLGISRAAFDMALRYAGWDPDKRKGFDLAYSMVRDAVGLPFNAQGDLFTAAEDAGVDQETAAEAVDRIWGAEDADKQPGEVPFGDGAVDPDAEAVKANTSSAGSRKSRPNPIRERLNA